MNRIIKSCYAKRRFNASGKSFNLRQPAQYAQADLRRTQFCFFYLKPCPCQTTTLPYDLVRSFLMKHADWILWVYNYLMSAKVICNNSLKGYGMCRYKIRLHSLYIERVSLPLIITTSCQFYSINILF